MGDVSCCRALYAPVHDAATEMAGAREIDQSLLDDLVMPSYIYEVEVAPGPRKWTGKPNEIAQSLLDDMVTPSCMYEVEVASPLLNF